MKRLLVKMIAVGQRRQHFPTCDGRLLSSRHDSLRVMMWESYHDSPKPQSRCTAVRRAKAPPAYAGGSLGRILAWADISCRSLLADRVKSLEGTKIDAAVGNRRRG